GGRASSRLPSRTRHWSAPLRQVARGDLVAQLLDGPLGLPLTHACVKVEREEVEKAQLGDLLDRWRRAWSGRSGLVGEILRADLVAQLEKRASTFTGGDTLVERDQGVVQVAQLGDESGVEWLAAHGAVDRAGRIGRMAVRAEERVGTCRVRH